MMVLVLRSDIVRNEHTSDARIEHLFISIASFALMRTRSYLLEEWNMRRMDNHHMKLCRNIILYFKVGIWNSNAHSLLARILTEYFFFLHSNTSFTITTNKQLPCSCIQKMLKNKQFVHRSHRHI